MWLVIRMGVFVQCRENGLVTVIVGMLSAPVLYRPVARLMKKGVISLKKGWGTVIN